MIPFLVGVIVAIVLIAIYVGITGRRGAKTPTVRQPSGRGESIDGAGVVVS